jgi:hypothetical protein
MRRLKQASKKLPCYYCGLPGGSLEHAPPEMMFAAFECDSITVPSCEAHNTRKSRRDQAIVTSIAMAARQLMLNYPESRYLTKNVRTAVNRLEPEFRRAKKDVQLRDYGLNPRTGLNIQLPYLESSVELAKWMRQLTAALVWSVVGKRDTLQDWDKAWSWSPTWHPTNSPEILKGEDKTPYWTTKLQIEEYLKNLSWAEGWSAEPRKYPADIYSFGLHIVEPSELDEAPLSYDAVFGDKASIGTSSTRILFQHRFYNAILVWYVGFVASQEAVTCLAKAIAQPTIPPSWLSRIGRWLKRSARSSHVAKASGPHRLVGGPQTR